MALAFVRGIHQWTMNSLRKGPVTRKMFPFDEVIMNMWKPTWYLTEYSYHGWLPGIYNDGNIVYLNWNIGYRPDL